MTVIPPREKCSVSHNSLYSLGDRALLQPNAETGEKVSLIVDTLHHLIHKSLELEPTEHGTGGSVWVGRPREGRVRWERCTF